MGSFEVWTHCTGTYRVALSVLIACVVGGWADSSARGGVPLVADGRPQAVVVIGDDAEAVARYAAEEFIFHVERATGARLPIMTETEARDAPSRYRVYLGATEATRRAEIDAAALGPEVALLRTLDDALFIVGRDEPGDPVDESNWWRGTLWGVYEFLDRELEVRWLWPGELGVHVPRRSELVIGPLDERYEPELERRRLRSLSRVRGRNDPRFGFTEQGMADYFEAEHAFLARHRMGRSDDPRPYTGHSFTGWWEQYGETHPEWFELSLDGRRGPPNPERPWAVSMCVSNPEFQREIVRRWLERREREPERVHTIRIGENDTHARCHCEPCLALDDPQPTREQVAAMPRYVRRVYFPTFRYRGELPDEMEPLLASTRYATFARDVHRLAREHDPDAIVTAFVYVNYFPAPEREVELHPNVVLSFVPYPGWWFPRTDAEQQWVKQQWDRWRDTGATLYYRPNYTLDGYAMPHVYTHQLAEAFQHYLRNGAIGTDFDLLMGQWATQGPTMYVLARLHARPEAEVDELLAEYYGAFGPASEAVEVYFDYWERYTLELLDRVDAIQARYNASRLHTYPRMAHAMFTSEAFEEAQGLLDRATAAVADAGPVYRQRVAFLGDGLEHARRCAEVARLFADDATGAAERREALESLAMFRRSIEDFFVANYVWLCYAETRSWKGLPGFFDD